MKGGVGNTPSVEAPAEPCDAWLSDAGRGWSPEHLEVVRKACQVAQSAHAGQIRASGAPFVEHPIAVARILDELNLDHETVAAAILHDVLEDTHLERADLEAEFGGTIAALVDGVTKMDVIDGFQGQSDARGTTDIKQVDALRKLLLAMVDDVRVVLIKLADRLHNMRTLRYLSRDKQRRVARETLDIYAPLASRLGIWQVKWEMEDLAFRYLEPENYRHIATQLDERRIDRERYISEVVSLLGRELEETGVRAQVTGRPKHIHSIWRKMKAKRLDFHQLFDVRAVRVLVDTVADCYAALGVVHTLWQHIPREFDDYITNPKSNRYQSLHTAVVGPGGKTLEVQIRTREMHEHAELGVAAHWRYKDGSARDAAIEDKIAWLRQVLEWRDDPHEPGGFMDRFHAEVFHDRVYVFTPRGRVLDLPKGATPLDFAYHIHTDVGHRCRGAKVDGSIVPLTHELHTGEQVEILTAREGGPSRDWLNPHLGYITTARARAKARHWFKAQDYEKNLAGGREVWDRELKRLGVEAPDKAKLLKRFNFVKFDDLLAGIGAGDVTTAQIAGALQDLLPEPEVPVHPRHRPPRKEPGGVEIQGVGNLLTHMAPCCKPVPFDAITGYITRGRGVTIHRKDCHNVLSLQESERTRLIDVEWNVRPEETYPVDVHLSAYDRQGLLRDVTAVFSNEHANVLAVNSRTDSSTRVATLLLTVEVTDLGQLSRMLHRLQQLPNVIEVERRV